MQPWNDTFVYHGIDYLRKIREDIAYLKGDTPAAAAATALTERPSTGNGIELQAAFLEGEQDPMLTHRSVRRSVPPPRSARSSGSGWRGTSSSTQIDIGRNEPVSDAESDSDPDAEPPLIDRVASPDARAAASAVLRGIRTDARSLSHQLVSDGHLARARLHFALDRLQTPREPPCKITQMRGRIPRPPAPPPR